MSYIKDMTTLTAIVARLLGDSVASAFERFFFVSLAV